MLFYCYSDKLKDNISVFYNLTLAERNIYYLSTNIFIANTDRKNKLDIYNEELLISIFFEVISMTYLGPCVSVNKY